MREILFFHKAFETIKNYFQTETVLESAVLVAAKIVTLQNGYRFIAKKVFVPKDSDYLHRTRTLVAFKPHFNKMVYEYVVEYNCHILLIHTHPFSTVGTTFSPHDDHTEQEVIGPFIDQYYENLHHASIVTSVDMNHMDARMWSKWKKTTIPIDRIKIIGVDGMHLIPTTTTLSKNKKTSYDERIHNRTVLTVGKTAQERFAQLTVLVAALGGIGSILVKFLARLPVKKLILVDPDRCSMSNLNRLDGATVRDAQYKRFKVHVQEREVRRINPNIQVVSIPNSFLNPSVQQISKQADAMFSGFDVVYPRLSGSSFALANGIPYFDCGTGIIAKSGVLENAGGQVIKIVPGGNFCIHCADYFSKENLSVELMSDEERNANQQLGYVSGEVNSEDATGAPSVYALNSQVASVAAWLFMRYISGDAGRLDGIAVDALSYETKPWIHPHAPVKTCPVCGKHGTVGHGDEVPFIKMPAPVTELSIPDAGKIHSDKKETQGKSQIDLVV